MKAIRIRNLHTNASIEVAELPQPVRRQPTDVLVRVLCIGLDGTDRELLQEHYGNPPSGETDLTNGHESLGVVIETGEASGFKPGDLVTALVRRPCRNPGCVNCRNGHSDFCETGEYVERGIKGAHGYLAEYYVEEERYLVPVSAKSLDYGMLAEPQSIVEKVWNEVTRTQQRLIWEPKMAIVLGAGPLGLLAAFTCRCLGLSTYVWSRGAEDSLPANLVRKAGAKFVAAPDESTAAAAASASGPPRSLKAFAEREKLKPDIIFECTGFSPLAFEAIDVLGPNGVLALLGVTPGKRTLTVPADRLNQEIVLENKCIFGSVNASRKDFETGLFRLQQMETMFPGLLGKLITNRLTLEQVPQLDFRQIAVKAVVDIVPQAEWRALVKSSTTPEYSFSV